MNAADQPDFSQMTRREIEDYLIERAMVEPGFRSRLLEEPEALLRELGLPVAEDVKIRVFVEEPKSFCIVLPRVLRELEELDDADLDGISGGRSEPDLFFQGYR